MKISLFLSDKNYKENDDILSNRKGVVFSSLYQHAESTFFWLLLISLASHAPSFLCSLDLLAGSRIYQTHLHSLLLS